jgi:hypothetical protein
MGESELIFFFLQGTGFDEETQGGAFAGLLVGLQGVAQTIGEAAVADGFIHGEITRLVGKRGCSEGDGRNQGGETTNKGHSHD